MRSLIGLLRKEGYHILRDRRTLTVLIVLPVLQVVLFGYAIRTDVRDVRLAIVDPTPDYATVALRYRFGAGGIFDTVAVVSRVDNLEPLFQSGRAQEALVFEPRFASHLASGVPARILVLTDATEPNTGSVLQSYALAVIGDYQRSLGGGRAVASRAREPDAFQSNPRELQPVRARPHGVRAYRHFLADDGDFAHARKGDRHDGDAARLAAAPVADHRRQGRALSGDRVRQRRLRSSSKGGSCSACRSAAASCSCSEKACSSFSCRSRSVS